MRDTIAPDHTAIQTMLEELFLPYAEWPEHRLEACCIRPGTKQIPARHFTREEIAGTAAWLSEMNQDGWNVYVGAGLRHERAPRRKRANKGHVELTRWLWLDFDAEGTAEAARATLAEYDLTPTFWVQTGSQPFERWHAWFRLDEPIDGKAAEGLMDRLVKALDADPAPKARSGVMRLAGGVSWPKPDKEGRVAELVERHEGNGRTYGAGEIQAVADALNPPPPPKKPRNKLRGRAAVASRARSEQIAELLQWVHPDEPVGGDTPYEHWLHVGMALHDHGEPIDTWDAWSQRSQAYDWHELESKWASFGKTSGGLTIGTLFKMAGDAGADLGEIARMGTTEATQRPAEGREGLPVGEAREKLRSVVRGFPASRAEAPIQMVNATLGLGKTHTSLEMIADAIRAGEEGGVVVIATPAHKLSAQIAADFERIAPDLKAAVLRGPDANDPDAPGEKVCKQRDKYREAEALLLDPEKEVCRTCPVRMTCRVMTDRLARADVYIVAHQALAGTPVVDRQGPPSWWMAEHLDTADRKATAQSGMKSKLDALAARRKKALAGLTGEKRLAAVAKFKRQREAILAEASEAVAAVNEEKAEGKNPREGQHILFTVIDEDPTGALLFGTDTPRVMGMAAWLSSPDGDDEELKAARKWLSRVVEKNGVGPLRRESMLAGGDGDLSGIGLVLARLHAQAGAKLEWQRKQPKSAAKELLEHNRSVRKCAAIWREIADFIATGNEATGRLEVVADAEKGLAIRHMGLRRVHDGWKSGGMLLLDATGQQEIAEAVFGEKVKVHNVVADQPNLRVVQDTSRAFGKSMFLPGGRNNSQDSAAPNNVKKLHRWVLARADEVAPKQFGLVTYKDVVEQLEEMGLPDNVVVSWFGSLRGSNAMQFVAAMGIVGRPLPEEHALGRMAAALTGHPVSGRYDLVGEVERLVAASGGLWWRTGTAASHPDAMAQRLLESTRDAEVWQAIGRPRAVNRDEPVTVYLLSDAVVPCPVELADVWKNPFARMLDAGGMAFASAAHAARAYPEMWRSKQAASKESDWSTFLYRSSYIRKLTGRRVHTELEYRIPRAADVYTVLVDTSRHPDPVAALLDVLPEAVDVRVIAPPEVHKPLVTAYNEANKALEKQSEIGVDPADTVLVTLRADLTTWKNSKAYRRIGHRWRGLSEKLVAQPM